jgi:hypothetical protein
MFRTTLAIVSLSLFLLGTAAASLELEPCIDGDVSPDGLSVKTDATPSS